PTDRKTLLATPAEPRQKAARKGESVEERRARQHAVQGRKAATRKSREPATQAGKAGKSARRPAKGR
ncbi:MAG: hypothetical protein RI936_1701, partial [Pseudomonadota bacterium]